VGGKQEVAGKGKERKKEKCSLRMLEGLSNIRKM
jgi:hypothetical protein